MHSSSQLSVITPTTKANSTWKMPRRSINDWLDCIVVEKGKIIESRKKWEKRQYERREKIFVEPTFGMRRFERRLRLFNILHDKYLKHD